MLRLAVAAEPFRTAELGAMLSWAEDSPSSAPSAFKDEELTACRMLPPRGQLAFSPVTGLLELRTHEMSAGTFMLRIVPQRRALHPTPGMHVLRFELSAERKPSRSDPVWRARPVCDSPGPQHACGGNGRCRSSHVLLVCFSERLSIAYITNPWAPLEETTGPRRARLRGAAPPNTSAACRPRRPRAPPSRRAPRSERPDTAPRGDRSVRAAIRTPPTRLPEVAIQRGLASRRCFALAASVSVSFARLRLRRFVRRCRSCGHRGSPEPGRSCGLPPAGAAAPSSGGRRGAARRSWRGGRGGGLGRSLREHGPRRRLGSGKPMESSM